MSEVRLELSSRPQSVTLLRSAVAGFAAANDLPAGLANALKTAVSEAANNVVVHAYGGDPGPLSLILATDVRGIEVLVQDEGDGFQRVTPSFERTGLGLPVISALADRAEFATRPQGGTEVRLTFGYGAGESDGDPVPYAPGAFSPPPPVGGEIRGSLCPAEVLDPVLGHLLRAVAAQVRFSVSRIDALRPLTRALAGLVPTAPEGEPMWFSISPATREIELCAGPFADTSPVVAELVDDVRIEDSDDGRYLHLTVSDPR